MNNDDNKYEAVEEVIREVHQTVGVREVDATELLKGELQEVAERSPIEDEGFSPPHFSKWELEELIRAAVEELEEEIEVLKNPDRTNWEGAIMAMRKWVDTIERYRKIYFCYYHKPPMCHRE